jgi:hypothetical protein
MYQIYEKLGISAEIISHEPGNPLNKSIRYEAKAQRWGSGERVAIFKVTM